MKRVRNTVANRDRERVLSRVATRGVVKFFNVVQNQQKEIEIKVKEAGPYERKIDKVYNTIDRKSFLDKLKESNDRDSDDFDEEKEKSQKPTWNVLREDFLMNGEMKNWDKKDENGDDEGEDEDDDEESEKEKTKKTKKNNSKNRNKKFKK